MVDTPFEAEIRVGEVRDAESFSAAEKPHMTKLRIDLGDEVVQSAAQLDYHYEPAGLVGRRVLCATTLGTVHIAGFESEVLTVGVPSTAGYPVLVSPDDVADVELGGLLY